MKRPRRLVALGATLLACASIPLYLRCAGWIGSITHVAIGNEAWIPIEVMEFVEVRRIPRVTVAAHRTGWTTWQADGPVRAWYANGQLNLEGQCRADQRDGIWRQYDRQGNVALEQVFQLGTSTGTWTWWESGRRSRTERYASGTRVEATDYDAHGEITQVVHGASDIPMDPYPFAPPGNQGTGRWR